MAPSQWDNYAPDPTPDPEAARPQPKRPVRSDAEVIARRKRIRNVVVGIVGAAGIAFVGWIVYAIVDTATQPGPQTADGFDDMVSALEEERDSTEVFRAVIYPEYASIDVPYADDERSINYVWRGSLDESSRSTSTETVFDLASIDPALFGGMCSAVKALVEEPGDCYLVVEAPDPDYVDEEGWIAAYASNEFSQTAYIEYDLGGGEVNRYVS